MPSNTKKDASKRQLPAGLDQATYAKRVALVTSYGTSYHQLQLVRGIAARLVRSSVSHTIDLSMMPKSSDRSAMADA